MMGDATATVATKALTTAIVMRIFTSRDSGSNDRGAFFKRKERECLVVFLGSIRID